MERRPRAVIVLVQGDREIHLGPVDPPGRCDLGFVDDLLRLQLIARRFGWALRIEDVRADLREMFEVVGLSDQLDR